MIWSFWMIEEEIQTTNCKINAINKVVPYYDIIQQWWTTYQLTEIEAINIKMYALGHELSEQALSLCVLNNLPEQYECKMLEHKMQILQYQKNQLWKDKVQTEMNIQY
jgi:hypothetical protein